MNDDRGFGGSQSQSRKVLKPIRTIMVAQINQAEPSSDDGPVLLNDYPIEYFVMCAIVKEYSESPKKIEVWDSTGEIDLRIPNNRELPEDIEENVGKFANIYGHFRIFNGKRMTDVDRIEFNISPYQFLYHEVEAAREWYNYANILPIDDTTLADKANEKIETKLEESLFVADSSNEELKQRILDIIKGADENDDDASSEYISRELCLDESEWNPTLNKLANDGVIYEVGGCFRISELQ